MSEKKPYIVSLCLDESCTKKKIKASPSARFRLVGVVAVGMQVDDKIRVIMPLTTMEFEDFKLVAEKYGIPVEVITGYVTEIKEEKKGEQVIKFEAEQ